MLFRRRIVFVEQPSYNSVIPTTGVFAQSQHWNTANDFNLELSEADDFETRQCQSMSTGEK